MLSQFTRELDHHISLADLKFNFPNDVYPVGRLDADSEGLLILSSNKKVNRLLLDPKNKKPKTYWVQVEGIPAKTDLDKLRNGIQIRIKSEWYETLAAKLERLENIEDQLPKRNPPIRKRENIPTSWVQISIIEGKNRQIRKMFAKIYFPVLRLVRVSIAGFYFGQNELMQMKSADIVTLSDDKLINFLLLNPNN